MLDYYLHVPGNTVDRLASVAASKKMEYYLGCDWLHEISITIRRTKQTNIPNERLEKFMFLVKCIHFLMFGILSISCCNCKFLNKRIKFWVYKV
jgi:hypothetical protein